MKVEIRCHVCSGSHPVNKQHRPESGFRLVYALKNAMSIKNKAGS